MTDAKKYLSGLTLLDRFLFAEAVEDQEVMQLILEIIPGQEIHLAGPPQTEKEARRSPQYQRSRYYRYTFRMNCMENKERILGDGAVRIFLNTRGKNPQDVSPELVQLLHFMEHTNDPPPPGGECEKVQKLRRKIENIKANEEVGVRFMHAWEERELDRIEARNAGLEAGRTELLTNLVQRKLAKGQSPEKIAEDLMEELETIQKIADSLMQTDLL